MTEAPTQAQALSLGGMALKSATDKSTRFSMLLWGKAKCGKTTLAATAPGVKLWINFDPDGTDSLKGYSDVIIADYSAERPDVIIPKLKDESCLGLGVLLKEHPEIETIVLDSTTILTDRIQQYACKQKNLMQEEPGQRGYAVKNAYTKMCIDNVLRIGMEYGRNVIIIAHEGPADKDKDGNVLGYGIAISDSLESNLTAKPSEVWHIEDTGNGRRIAVRPCRQRSPMGTRMFDAIEPEFMWRYDPVSRKGEGLNDWFKRWQEKGSKIPLPR